MIIQGKEGSLVLFWNDKLISSLPLGKRTVEEYLNEANTFILNSMREDKKNIKELVYYTKNYCELHYKKKLKGKKIDSTSHCYFQLSLLALVRLGLIDFDEVCLIAPRKQVKSKT